MKLHSAVASHPARPKLFGLLSCPNCLETLIAPVASEYVGEGRVRHSWSCDGCGHEFHTAVRFGGR
jgi:hypothetical protein